MKYTYRILFIASLFIGCTSNDEADEPETGIPFNSAGPISGSAGLNSFTFGGSDSRCANRRAGARVRLVSVTRRPRLMA